MEKIPQGRYAKEFREEAARLVIDDRLSSREAVKNFLRGSVLSKIG